MPINDLKSERFSQKKILLHQCKLLQHQSFAGIVFSDYHEQLKLQRNASMVALRGLGYGKKSVENKIIEEAEYLSRAFKVSIYH